MRQHPALRGRRLSGRLSGRLGVSGLRLVDQLLEIGISLAAAVLFRNKGGRVFAGLGIDGLFSFLASLLALGIGCERQNCAANACRGSWRLLALGCCLARFRGVLRVCLRCGVSSAAFCGSAGSLAD